MEDLAAIAGAALGVVMWWSLVRSMRSNGRTWWWRHLAGISLGPFAIAGMSLCLSSLAGAQTPEGEPLGLGGALIGILVALPMIVPLIISWRASTSASVEKQPLSASSTPGPSEQSGNLHFIYEDAQGNTTTREISSWRDDGVYIKGFCHDRQDTRTFRRDRIVTFLAGEELLDPVLEEFVDEPIFSGPAMEILFTGFSSDDREDLEADAEDAGLLVRKTVTKNLMFVCAGPRAGATKLSKARAQGCTILDGDQFQAMLATGEVPCA